MDGYSTPVPRRTFLRGLAMLPLIGGAVNIVGRPIAADITVTDALHARYTAFLAFEHRAAVREHAYRAALVHYRTRLMGTIADGEAWATEQASQASYLAWAPSTPDIEALVASDRPSNRAAVILSAAGLSLA